MKKDYNIIFDFNFFKNQKGIEISTKLIGVIVQDAIEKKYVQEKSLTALKKEIINRINEYLKFPIIKVSLKEEKKIIYGYIEIRNRLPIKFKFELL